MSNFGGTKIAVEAYYATSNLPLLGKAFFF